MLAPTTCQQLWKNNFPRRLKVRTNCMYCCKHRWRQSIWFRCAVPHTFHTCTTHQLLDFISILYLFFSKKLFKYNICSSFIPWLCSLAKEIRAWFWRKHTWLNVYISVSIKQITPFWVYISAKLVSNMLCCDTYWIALL